MCYVVRLVNLVGVILGIIFSLYCLAKYADHQDKCYEEACRILESKESIEW